MPSFIQSMVLERLTPQDQARHERAIERMRRQIFRTYQPTDYFIVPGSERVLAASAERCWNAACGEYRVLRWGGLSYSVNCADDAGHSRFTVSHVEADQFNFWLVAAKGHTLTALIVRFRVLDETVHSYVCSYRRANIAPTYMGLIRP